MTTESRKYRRPKDRDYYESRTEHFAQGDLFRDVLFTYPVPPKTNAAVAAGFPEIPVAEQLPGMLINYTSTMLAQPPGPPSDTSTGYKIHSRILVPIVPLDLLRELGVSDEIVSGVVGKDLRLPYMYLPPLVDAWEKKAVALLYRPFTVHHELIAPNRVMQLTWPATVHLQLKLAGLFAHVRPGGQGPLLEKDVFSTFAPDLTDHWSS